MGKKITYLLFSVLLLFSILPSVSADKIMTSSTQGLQINSWTVGTIPQNKAYNFVWDVSDANGLLMNNTEVSCFVFMQKAGTTTVLIGGSSGTGSTPVGDTKSWYKNVAGGNFSLVGTYNYQLDCYRVDNASISGNLLDTFEVTPSGTQLTMGVAVINIGLLFMFMIFLVGCVVLFMENDHILAKVGFLGLGYLLTIAITFISWIMANDFLPYTPFIADMFRILFFVLVIGLFPLLLGAFSWYVIMLFKIKEIERLMDKGFGMEEAQERVNGRKKR